MVKKVTGYNRAFEMQYDELASFARLGDENLAAFSVQDTGGNPIGSIVTVGFTGTVRNGTTSNPVFNGWVKLIVTSGGLIVADGGGIKEKTISNLAPGASINVSPATGLSLLVRDTDRVGDVVAKAELYRSDFTLLGTIGPEVVGINTGVDVAVGNVTMTGSFSIS